MPLFLSKILWVAEITKKIKAENSCTLWCVEFTQFSNHMIIPSRFFSSSEFLSLSHSNTIPIQNLQQLYSWLHIRQNVPWGMLASRQASIYLEFNIFSIGPTADKLSKRPCIFSLFILRRRFLWNWFRWRPSPHKDSQFVLEFEIVVFNSRAERLILDGPFTKPDDGEGL